VALTTSKTIHRPRGVVRVNNAITTASDGSVAATSIGSFFGRLVGILYDAGDLATGVDITLRDVRTGAALFTGTDLGTSDLVMRPTQVPVGVVKTAVTPGAGYDGTKDIYVAGELELVVAGGGDTKSGKFDLIIDEQKVAAA